MALRLRSSDPEIPSTALMPTPPMVDQQQPETWGQFGLRNLLGTASDVATSVLGMPGSAINAATSAVSGLQDLLQAPGIVEDEGFIPYSKTIERPQFATTESIKSHLPDYLTKRKSSGESFLRDLAADVPFVVGGGTTKLAKYGSAITKSLLANATERGVTALAGEKAGQIAKFGSYLLLNKQDMNSAKINVKDQNRELWNGAMAEVQPTPGWKVSSETSTEIADFKRSLPTGKHESKSADVIWKTKAIEDLEDLINNPEGVDPRLVYNSRVQTNNQIGNPQSVPAGVSSEWLGYLTHLKNLVLQEWAKRFNPMAGEALAISDELVPKVLTADAQQQQAVRGINWMLEKAANGLRRSGAVLHGILNSQQTLEGLDPLTQKLALQTMTDSALQSAPAAWASINRLEKHLEKQEQKTQSSLVASSKLPSGFRLRGS